MTRITNFGRKRTYVEAGFHQDAPTTDDHTSTPVEASDIVKDGEHTNGPQKKKRKRTKKAKTEDVGSGGTAEGQEQSPSGDQINANKVGGGITETPDASQKSIKGREKKIKAKDKRLKDKAWRAAQSEQRRQKRMSERQADTICFACRAKGHAARDCPTTKVSLNNEDGNAIAANSVVGMCYRCGSNRHSLSRCKKPADSSNPLPFASCFVCSGKGHLASSCPQNKAKGIYPNGGCCKLCGETTHLARDCGLRKDEGTNKANMMFGTGREAGADEDDFHSFKRKRAEVDTDEKKEDKAKRLLAVKAGAHSGIVKSFGKPIVPPTKKVVYF